MRGSHGIRWACTTLALVGAIATAGCGGGDDDPGAPPRAALTASKPVERPILWGAWFDSHRTGGQPPWDMSAAEQLERSVGKRMSLLAFGTPFYDSSATKPYVFPTKLFEAVRTRGAMPLFSWAAQPQRVTDNPDFTLRAIADGRQDAYLRSWAQAAKAWGHPFLLRFDWEMNGDWFPWAPAFDHLPPEAFVTAWRHVHNLFESVGATNAQWVWCPVTDEFGVEQPKAPLYPGSGYVDWTCLDGYNRNAPWASATQVFAKAYDEITRRIAPDKPMLLGEVASTEDGGDKAVWITDFLRTLPSRFPRIRAFAWFDRGESGAGERHHDWALDSSATATRAFARGIRSAAYAAGRPR